MFRDSKQLDGLTPPKSTHRSRTDVAARFDRFVPVEINLSSVRTRQGAKCEASRTQVGGRPLLSFAVVDID